MMLYYVSALNEASAVTLVLSNKGTIYYSALGSVSLPVVESEFSKLKGYTVAPIENYKGELSLITSAVNEYCKLLQSPLLSSKLQYEMVFGTNAQHRVWEQLVRIPAGTTTTYAEITQALDLPSTHVRAVANACGANRLALIVPCHRVVRKGGDLSGYRWGVFLKRQLLRKEAIANKRIV